MHNVSYELMKVYRNHHLYSVVGLIYSGSVYNWLGVSSIGFGRKQDQSSIDPILLSQGKDRDPINQ